MRKYSIWLTKKNFGKDTTFLHKRNRRFETQLKAKERLACVVGIKRGRENYAHQVLAHLDFPFPLLLKCLLQDYKSSCGNVSSFFVYFQSRWNDLFGNAQRTRTENFLQNYLSNIRPKEQPPEQQS